VTGNPPGNPCLCDWRGNPACRRCLLNRHDWSSCTACFRYARRGSGRIPYYGLRKRSVLAPAPEDEVVECCALTGNPECCRQVELFRGGAMGSSEARLEQGRRGVYLPVLAEESDEIDPGAASACSCCDSVLYDAICCQARCNA